MLTNVWYAFVHWTGCDYGAPYGHFVPYDFWSGITGSFLTGLLGAWTLFWWHHTCHNSWHCLRWGRYEAAGGIFRVCRRHHPDMKHDHGSMQDMIHRMNKEWKEHTCASP